MIFIYCLTALLIAWVWIDYFRIIDIFEKDKLIYFIISFLLGGSSVLIVFGLNELFLDEVPLYLNGQFLNDLLYSVLKIGAVEEFAKLVPFLVTLPLFRKQINEPIDYLALICASALGFSAVENVLYFNLAGPEIISARAILSSIGHMFDSSLIAYGIILVKYRYDGARLYLIPLFFAFAALSHGFYDFWLLYEAMPYGLVITIIYFLISVSWFAVILNNALNNSSYFTYKKVLNSHFIAAQLLTYYLGVYIIQFILIWTNDNIYVALSNFLGALYTSGFLVVVISIRLSRFRLIKNHWHTLKIEFPFTIGAAGQAIKIKGDGYNEALINSYYQELFYLKPLSIRNTFIGNKRLALIEKKFYSKEDQVYYQAKVYHGNQHGEYETIFLRPKRKGVLSKGEKPIVAIMLGPSDSSFEHWSFKNSDFKFKEWGLIEAKTEE